MINRKSLYGYRMERGRWVIVENESAIVRMVFALYSNGLSYQKISDYLNKERIPFSMEVPSWNMPKVRRLLQNLRYTGQDGYPAIIENKTYRMVQEQIQSKAKKHMPSERRSALALKDYLRCGHCAGHLHRTAGKNRRKDTLYLKCSGCGAVFTITDVKLLEEVAQQAAELNVPAETAYQPSEEVIRLTNAINRGLENPESPEEIVFLILRGISVRYDCCPAAIQYESTDRQPNLDWNHIRQAVSYITISAENTVAVKFR